MRTVIALAALPLLAACGGGGSDSSTADDKPTTAVAPTAPACSDVWVAGQTLPADYEGCMHNDSLMAAAFFPCNDDRKLYQHADDFWAWDGDVIHEEPGGAASANAYSAAYAACNG